MSWLSKLGKGLTTAFRVAAPVAQQLAPLGGPVGIGASIVVGELQQMTGVVGIWEAAGEQLKTKGSKLDKASLAIPAITQTIMASQVMVGKRVIDPEGFQKAMTMYNEATVLLMKSIEDKDDGVVTGEQHD